MRFVIAFSLVLALGGCHNARQATLHADLATLTAARDEYTAWDPARQKALVDDVKAKGGSKDDAIAAVELFRKTIQVTMLDVFSYAFEDVAKAATSDDSASLAHASKVVKEVFDQVHGAKPSEDLRKVGPDLPCKHSESGPVPSICEGR